MLIGCLFDNTCLFIVGNSEYEEDLHSGEDDRHSEDEEGLDSEDQQYLLTGSKVFVVRT